MADLALGVQLPPDAEKDRRFLADPRSQKKALYVFEGLLQEDGGPRRWYVTLRRGDGKRSWYYGGTPREALLEARAEVEQAIAAGRQLHHG